MTWLAPDRHFKVVMSIDIEYLKNDKRFSHIYYSKKRWVKLGLLWGGKGLEWFPVLVGPEVCSPTRALLQLHSRFLPTDYGYLLQRCRQMMDPRPARLQLTVALLPVPAWWQTPCFQIQSEYPRGQLAWTDSPGTANGGSYSWIWTGRPFPLPVGPMGGVGRRHHNRLASGRNKTRFSMWKARTLTVNIPNYTENWKLRLTWLLTFLHEMEIPTS